MRVNCSAVLAAFIAGRPCHAARSIWTNGTAIYSYSTCIATPGDDGGVIFNATRYSVTTTIHQNALRAALPIVAVVDDAPLGCSQSRLLDMSDGAIGLPAASRPR